MIEIVNIIASGTLNTELDLSQLTRDIGAKAEYDPDNYPGLYLRFGEDAPLVTVYRTGKYITTGSTSKEEVHEIRERFLNLFSDLGVVSTDPDDNYQIQNYVCTGELDRQLNLNALAIGLGLENTEYEPEQFPGLIYRPTEVPCVALLFASGRVVITGSPSLKTAEDTFQQISQRIAKLL